MHANLVGASRFDRHFEQGVRPNRARDPYQSDGALPIWVVLAHHFDAALPFALTRRHGVFEERHIDHFFIGRPQAQHQGQIGLARLTVTKLVLQMFECAPFFGDQQHARGLAV